MVQWRDADRHRCLGVLSRGDFALHTDLVTGYELTMA